jgi:RNA polymerase sigma-70 factor, ECF subfamily
MSVQPDQLLAALKNGEPQAVETWFKQYYRLILNFVRTKINSEHDAEEITQEIFINCLKHLPLFRGNASIKTWMIGIARHEVADYYRKKYAKKAILALPMSELLSEAHIGDAHDVSEKVRSVIQSMSQHNRELLLLKYIDGKKVGEIALEMGKSIKAIESELFRARQEFKALYQHSHV